MIHLNRTEVLNANDDAIILVEGNLAYIVERQPDGGIIHSKATKDHMCYPISMAHEGYLESGDWVVIPYVKSKPGGESLYGAGNNDSHTIRWINDDYIYQAFKALDDHDLEWLDSIINRPSGSTWNDGMNWQQLAALSWNKLPKKDYVEEIHRFHCDYYHYEDSSVGLQGMKLLSNIVDLSSVKLVDGAHGKELVSSEVELQETNEAWLVIGQNVTQDGRLIPAEFNRTVWTGFPGEIAISIKYIKEFDGTLESLIAVKDKYPIAVKAVR